MIWHIDWALGLVALVGVHLTGKKMWQGQAVSAVNSVLLASMNVYLHMYGFVPVCVLIAIISGRNAVLWRSGKL